MKITRRTFSYGMATALSATATPRFLNGVIPGLTAAHEIDVAHGWELYEDGKLIQSDITLPHAVVPLSWHGWQPSSWEKVWTYRLRAHLKKAVHGERLFLNFERALANATVTVNGQTTGSHEGGFTPFEFEITQMVREGLNEIEVEVDSRWLNVPPSGSPRGAPAVDYYLPGGLNGAVSLRSVPRTSIGDIWAQTKDVLSDHPSLDIFATISTNEAPRVNLTGRLYEGATLLRSVIHTVPPDSGTQTITLPMDSLRGVKLWSSDAPQLYRLVLSLSYRGTVTHTKSIRIGFREAKFELDGFYLNGKKLRLFGLNRHELFPYVGFGASPRAMRHDAAYLKNVLNCNAVRCSHYPQSTAFLDACDELGLMVWEEVPGWQYLGDQAWKDIAVRNAEEMIQRDRNHPSIIVWGTRVNESANDPEFYERTRTLAKKLDPTRPASGSMTPSSRSDWKERWHEDVFAFDDYHAAPDGSVGIDPALPGVPYMLAEAVGQYSYGTAKNFLRRYRRAGVPEEQNSQALLHAQAHDRAAADPRNAGVIAWCGYDYASPMNAYNGVKCPGVVDTFRIPKLGASFYMAQVDPKKRVILEPSFYWDARLHAASGKAAVFSNCEELRIFLDDQPHDVRKPNRADFPNIPYPPFMIELPWSQSENAILRIDGYIAGRKAISRSLQGSRTNDRLWIKTDDTKIVADGIDTTRVSFGIADQFGNTRPIADGKIKIALEGPGRLIGDSEFELGDSGAVGAIWVQGTAGGIGEVTISATHLGFDHSARAKIHLSAQGSRANYKATRS